MLNYLSLNLKVRSTVAGLLVFESLADALRAGFQIYDRIQDGYLVRTRTPTGWAMAIVNCK